MADPIDIPSLDPSVTAMDTSTTSFSDYVDELAGSCDLSGALSTLIDEITRSVVDPVTGVISDITQSTTEAMADIRDKMSKLYDETLGVLGAIGDQLNRAQELLAEALAKIGTVSEILLQQLQTLIDRINSEIVALCTTVSDATRAVLSQISSMLSKIGKLVKNLGMAMCGALTNAISGSSHSAPGNTSTTNNVNAVKDQLDNGVTDQKDLTSAMARANGLDGNIQGTESSIDNASNTMNNSGPAIFAIEDAVNNLETFVGTL